jgi:hypothetical protein
MHLNARYKCKCKCIYVSLRETAVWAAFTSHPDQLHCNHLLQCICWDTDGHTHIPIYPKFLVLWSWYSPVSTVTTLQAGRQRFDSRGGGNEGTFLGQRIQTSSGAPQASYPMGTRAFFPRIKLQRRETNHSPHLLARLRICGAISSLLNTSYLITRTTLSYLSPSPS